MLKLYVSGPAFLALGRRAEGEDALAVDVRPEGHPAAGVAGDPVMADHSGLDVDDVDTDLDKVADDFVRIAVGVEPDIQACRTTALEHGGVTRFENPQPD